MGRYDGDRERLTAVAEDSLESSTQLSEEDLRDESSESFAISELLQQAKNIIEEKKSNLLFFKNKPENLTCRRKVLNQVV